MSFTTQADPNYYQPMDFGDDLSPREVPVKMGGKNYVLKEASAAAVCQYRNAITAAAKMGPDGKPTAFGNVADAEPLLVSLCLFEVRDGKQLPVPLIQVRGWKNSVTSKLFERVQKISDMVGGDEETADTIREKMDKLQEKLNDLERNGTPAKKEQPQTTDSSA